MPRSWALVLLVATLSGTACSGKRAASRAARLAEDDSPAPIQVIGISPLEFRCDLVANVQSVAQAVGVAVEPFETGFSPPAGVARPCHYQSTAPDRPGEWSFDLDCRERALDTGNQLMAEFASDPAARPVLVGKTGIDHHGIQLLFVDDDTPCYVRVMGKGEAERLALARLVADGLVRTNAPGRVQFRE
jgi:hypothetical protein